MTVKRHDLLFNSLRIKTSLAASTLTFLRKNGINICFNKCFSECIAVLSIVPQCALRNQRHARESTSRAGGTACTIYTVSVDYGQTLKVIHDKSRSVEKVEIELIKYDADMEYDDVITDLDARDLRPAMIEELCAFGASYPDVQRQFPIIALGSPQEDLVGDRRFPFLARRGGCNLCLRWGTIERTANWRFAAVRK